MEEEPRKVACRSCGKSTPRDLVDADGDCVNCIVLGRKQSAGAQPKQGEGQE